MSVCTFFGHRECFGLDTQLLRDSIEALIRQGTLHFLVGNQGQFDSAVRSCLRSLQEQYPQIQYTVVLAYLPVGNTEAHDCLDTMYPEGLETVPPKFALDHRNRYMLHEADCCICYVNHSWGGAYKYARLAKRRGMAVYNLGTAVL